MTAIWEFLKPFWLKILQFAGIAFGIVLLWRQAKSSGMQEVRQKNIETTLKSVQDYDNKKDDLNRMPDNKLDELLQKYTRD